MKSRDIRKVLITEGKLKTGHGKWKMDLLLMPAVH